MNYKKVCLIGNNNLGKDVFDGQRVKVREYINIFKFENIDIVLVDLALIKKNPICIISKIKKGIEECDVVVFISASRGVRILLPFIVKICKKYKKRLVMPLIGSSVLHYHIDKLDKDQTRLFFQGKNDVVCKDKKLVQNLKSIDLILPETDILSEAFKSFYSINNVRTLFNFRTCNSIQNTNKNGKYIFVSRINANKGIFDLIEVVSEINKSSVKKIRLDIYGEFQLSKKEMSSFKSLLENNFYINYLGTLHPSIVTRTISNYNYLIFPTKFVSEGVPGVVVESLIAGTPVISSNYPQASCLLNNGINSIIFEMNNKDELKKALIFSENSYIEKKLLNGVLSSSDKCLYGNNREYFLDCIFGSKKTL